MGLSTIRGAGMNFSVLPAFGADSPNNLTASNNTSQFAQIQTNRYSLSAGLTQQLNAGQFLVQTGLYSQLQCLDPILNKFVPVGNAPGTLAMVFSDGTNYRLANTTGCPVSASITNQGSGYTNGIFVSGVNSVDGTAGITAVPSAGGSTWTIIVGGDVNATPTVVSGGTGYLYPPQAIISAPPQGGLPATGHCTISAGVATLVIDNQGAGYTNAPIVTIINDPRDTAGAGASFTLALTDSGKVTAVYPNNHGTPVTAVPTLTFSGGGGASAAATPIMNFSVTAYAVTTAGTTYTGNPEVRSGVNLIAAQAAPVNPAYTTGFTFVRPARISAALSTGGITATGQVVEDGGFGIQVVPEALIITNGTQPTIANAATLTLTVGGATDNNIFIQSV